MGEFYFLEWELIDLKLTLKKLGVGWLIKSERREKILHERRV
jgi:hypothetical protein